MEYSYQWLHDGEPIAGATGASYELTDSDAGEILTARVTATDGLDRSASAESNAVQVASDGDEMGDPEEDQTPASFEDEGSPASAIPMSPTGPAVPGSYTTDHWFESETGAQDGLRVVSSTAPGTFALTGFVRDAATDAPVGNATVTLASWGTSVVTSATAEGAYAFINMPTAGPYTLTINAGSYGVLNQINNEFSADEKYQTTSDLTTEPQTVDAGDVHAGTQGESSGSAGDTFSQLRPPPFMRVAMFDVWPKNPPPGHEYCHRSNSTQAPENVPVKRVPFDWYVLRVADGEVERNYYNQKGFTAFFSLIANYGWWHKTTGGARFDIARDASRQCYIEKKNIPRSWWVWVRDVLNERWLVSQSNRQLLQTRYNASSQSCNDSQFPNGGPIAAQGTIKHITTHNCPNAPVTDWRSVVKTWYGSPIVRNVAFPPIPRVTAETDSTRPNELTFDFTSRERTGGVLRDVAWKFKVERRTSSGSWVPAGKIVRFRTRGGQEGGGVCDWDPRTVPGCITVTPPAGCYKYRVYAGNPRGWTVSGRITSQGVGLERGEGTCQL